MITTNAKILKLSKAKDGDTLVVSSNTATQATVEAIANQINVGTTKLLAPVVLPSGVDLNELKEAQDGDVLVLFRDGATAEEITALSNTIRQKLGKRLTVIAMSPADQVDVFTKRGA